MLVDALFRDFFSKLMKKVIKKNALGVAKEWFGKIEFIKSQIKALEKLRQFPIIRISAFLLKSQLIEFELKQLILSLDLHLSSHNTSAILRRKIRTPKDLDNLKLGLGGLIQEIRMYESELLKVLINRLNKFNLIRVRLVHYLLDSESTIKDLNADSDIGLILSEEIIGEIERIKDEIWKKRSVE